MVSKEIQMELARVAMMEYTLNKLAIVFNDELRQRYKQYDHLAGWIKKGLLLGKLLEHCRSN